MSQSGPQELILDSYLTGGAPLPAAGGQGWPLGDIPADEEEPELEVPGAEEFEFDDPALEEPEFGEAEPEGPEFDSLDAPAVPGKVPQGDPPGVVSGAVVVFGFTVEGCVLVPLEGGFVEFDPGTLEGEVGGFTEPVGGAVGLLVGGAVEGVVVWLGPAEPELPAVELPLAGALWAATQVAQKKRTERTVSFLEDIADLLPRTIS